MSLLKTLIAWALIIQAVHSAKILGLFNTPSRSHVIVHDALMQELARRGHEVTVVSAFPPKGGLPKTYRFLHVESQGEGYKAMMQKWMKQAEDNEFSIFAALSTMQQMLQPFQDALYHPNVVQLKNETFDLLVLGWFMNDFQVGMAAHFKCPAVIVSTAKSSTITRRYVGNPAGLSHNPSFFLGSKGAMNLVTRIKNFVIGSLEYMFFMGFDYFYQQSLYEKHFPADQYPSYTEAKKNVSLVLVNQHFSEGHLESSLPGLVEIGGLHIKQPSKLPEDIQQFLDGATDGAVFFSLGSNARSSQLSVERRDAMLHVFSKLKQRVLWKWEDEHLPSQPENVMVKDWLPQNDILAHPNVKLFISHCGIGSVYESKYHGVPILAIPLFADQPANAKSIASAGWGLSLNLHEINELTFSRAVTEMLTNSSYSETVKELSAVYKDRPMSPLETGAYWVEYVIRHKGAKHMQSSAIDLNFFQYYSLDVVAILAVCVYLAIKIIKVTVLFIFRKLKSKSKKTKTD